MKKKRFFFCPSAKAITIVNKSLNITVRLIQNNETFIRKGSISKKELIEFVRSGHWIEIPEEEFVLLI